MRRFTQTKLPQMVQARRFPRIPVDEMPQGSDDLTAYVSTYDFAVMAG